MSSLLGLYSILLGASLTEIVAITESANTFSTFEKIVEKVINKIRSKNFVLENMDKVNFSNCILARFEFMDLVKFSSLPIPEENPRSCNWQYWKDY